MEKKRNENERLVRDVNANPIDHLSLMERGVQRKKRGSRFQNQVKRTKLSRLSKNQNLSYTEEVIQEIEPRQSSSNKSFIVIPSRTSSGKLSKAWLSRHRKFEDILEEARIVRLDNQEKKSLKGDTLELKLPFLDNLSTSFETCPTYESVTAKPSKKFSTRTFCSVCGQFATGRCSRCMSGRYCSLRCQDVHRETRCLKFFG